METFSLSTDVNKKTFPLQESNSSQYHLLKFLFIDLS